MTTQRQEADIPPLRGAYLRLHLHLTSGTHDRTTLANTVLRGQFHTPTGQPVRLKAGPRAALNALLSYGQEGVSNPTWRLDMNKFSGLFVETAETIYGWIRTLEATGFAVRERRNDPHTGKVEWHLDVSDCPGVIRGAVGNPQVTPIPWFSGDGASPPVDNSETPRSDHPLVFGGWRSPSPENQGMGTLYREITSKRLPASPPVPATREHDGEEEAAGKSPREQPTLSLVRPTVPTAAEAELAADTNWVDWVNGLLDHPAVIACRPLRPTRNDLHLLAVRAQVAVEKLGWQRDQLARRVLLVKLDNVNHLASVWLARLHPEQLGPAPARGEKTRVEQGQPDRDAMPRTVPDTTRRAEIRRLHGLGRGDRWQQRMGGGG